LRPLSHGYQFEDEKQSGDEGKFEHAGERIVAEVGQMVEIWSCKGKWRDVFPDIAKEHMEVGTGIKAKMEVEGPIQEFAAVDEDPIEVREAGENDSPLELFPPQDQKNHGGDDDEQVINDPNGVGKLRIGRMIGEIGEFVQKAMREKSQDGSQPKGQLAMFGVVERLLDDDTSEDVGWFLHDFVKFRVLGT